jgi:hypothetical protein
LGAGGLNKQLMKAYLLEVHKFRSLLSDIWEN